MVMVMLHASLTIYASNGTQSYPGANQRRQCVIPIMDSHFADLTASKPGISIVHDGTDEGIRSLLNRECELAMASRKMAIDELREAENRGMDIREASIGGVGIAVAVHPANPVDELTVDQVRQIFDGTITTWRQIGGESRSIHIVTVDVQGTGITGYLAQAQPGAPVQQIASQAKHSLEESNEVALVQVGNEGLQPKVKFLAIKKSEQSPGVLPSSENVERRMYPFIQPLYLCIDWKHATDHAKAFFTLCAGQNGHTPDK